MAKAARKAHRKTAAQARRRRLAARHTPRGKDAIALLKTDHREVASWFAQFQTARSGARKLELARKICAALRAHVTIEEELFYPAFLQATNERSIHHEAETEHDAAKRLIAEIERSGPDNEYYDAKVKVLAEMIKHHFREEEKPGGMFARARRSSMDLRELGKQLKTRKDELSDDGGEMRRIVSELTTGPWLLTP